MNAFAKNQLDLSLDDVKVIWCGQRIELYLSLDAGTKLGKFLTAMDAYDAVGKVQRWCVKNVYRCSQIRDGKILI